MKIKVYQLVSIFALSGSLCHSATTISGTGFTADSIVEAGAASAAAGSDFGVTSGWVLAQAGFAGIGAGVPIPANGAVSTVNGNSYQLASATGNNVLSGNNTFTLGSAAQYSDLNFLYTGIGSNSAVDATPYDNFTATVNFADASTTVLTASVNDWQNGGTFGAVSNAFAEKTAYVRNTNESTISLWVREISFDLSAGDQTKTISSITFNLADRGAVSGVSGTLVPEPSSAALLGGFGALLLLRRRR